MILCLPSPQQSAPLLIGVKCRGVLGDNPDISKSMRLLTACGQLTRTGRGGRVTPFFYSVRAACTASDHCAARQHVCIRHLMACGCLQELHESWPLGLASLQHVQAA